MAAVFSQPLLGAGAIALLVCLLTVHRWTPLLRSSLLLVATLGILGGWRSLHDAFHDRLTGLPNRALFLKHLERAIRQQRRRQNQPFGVFYLDLDEFRALNETLGRAGGDQLLTAIARRLSSFLGSTTVLARVGGNEFVALTEGVTTPDEAMQLADRLHAEIIAPFQINDRGVVATVSIGIALSSDYFWAHDLLKDAQLAMYHAKRQGRACHAVFQPQMRVQVASFTQLGADLRWAIERQELRLFYQALVSLQTKQIIGFEALVRWQHPKHGLITPSEFIPLAENTGLIVAIGRWTIRQACSQLWRWQQGLLMESSLLMSVNLSAQEFSQPHLSDYIQQVLRDTGIEGHRLKLEITESTLMSDLETAIATLNQIKSLGIQIGIDDFGTGYSSLSHLYYFPTDTLKIDQSFVRRLGHRSENDEIVRTIITLAHNLGMNVIAEGIETRRQLDLLRSLKCEYGQGYLFSKPLDREAATLLLTEQLTEQWNSENLCNDFLRSS
ncbi:MAG: bifunctional diguanylate cyclase/phosphodiesterase [Oculatellaceae cyanobacterium bins.114]|nr:bifunctional diguanylate cyclase/phosphodiesterase [Oculatellaceae cyanobacterium bins.114]